MRIPEGGIWLASAETQFIKPPEATAMTVWNMLVKHIQQLDTDPESEQMEDIATAVLVGFLVLLTIGAIL
jgi:hypothetical protein